MNLAESDPELAELVLLQVTSRFTFEVSSFSLFEKKNSRNQGSKRNQNFQLYHSSMAKAGLNDDAIAMANRSESLVEKFLNKV